jgi:hypothetical protein
VANSSSKEGARQALRRQERRRCQMLHPYCHRSASRRESLSASPYLRQQPHPCWLGCLLLHPRARQRLALLGERGRLDLPWQGLMQALR